MVKATVQKARLAVSRLAFARVLLTETRSAQSEYEPLYDIDGEPLADIDGELLMCLKGT